MFKYHKNIGTTYRDYDVVTSGTSQCNHSSNWYWKGTIVHLIWWYFSATGWQEDVIISAQYLQPRIWKIIMLIKNLRNELGNHTSIWLFPVNGVLPVTSWNKMAPTLQRSACFAEKQK